MNEPDLYANIIPGHSAAGFLLGTSITEFDDIIRGATCWDKSKLQLCQAVSKTDKWLLVEKSQLNSFAQPSKSAQSSISQGCRLYFGNEAVMLHFGQNGQLTYIQIGPGYQGALYGKLRIGDDLRSVLQFYDIEYDDVEELHFPTNGNDVGLISFYAEEQSLEKAPNQKIHWMFVGNIYQA